MSITMSQLASKMIQAANQTSPVLDRKMRTFVQVGVGYTKRAIQDVHAVDTGTMLNSTTSQSTGKFNFLIGPTVFYAPYVALGTTRMEGRPFHITVATQMRADVKDFFKPSDVGL